MIRLVSAASLLAVSVAIAPAAFAQPITSVEHFHTAKGTKVVDRVTDHTKTGVIDSHTKITREDGKTKTIAETSTPNTTGGYTVTKSVTGFDGVSKPTMSHTSATPGHADAGHAGGGHAGAGHGKA